MHFLFTGIFQRNKKLISNIAYNELAQNDNEWFCNSCSLPKFSESFFENCDDADIVDQIQPDETIDLHTHVQVPTEADVDEFQCFNQKGLHFIHINARSLLNKIAELQLIANKSKAAIISVTETWLDDSITNTEVNILGYTILRKDRNRCGGGVCMYVREDIAYTSLQLDSVNNTDEMLCVELLLPKTKPIIVGTCYRPPQQSSFVEQFEKCLSQLKADCEIILLGDLNICYKDQRGPLYK